MVRSILDCTNRCWQSSAYFIFVKSYLNRHFIVALFICLLSYIKYVRKKTAAWNYGLNFLSSFKVLGTIIQFIHFYKCSHFWSKILCPILNSIRVCTKTRFYESLSYSHTGFSHKWPGTGWQTHLFASVTQDGLSSRKLSWSFLALFSGFSCEPFGSKDYLRDEKCFEFSTLIFKEVRSACDTKTRFFEALPCSRTRFSALKTKINGL